VTGNTVIDALQIAASLPYEWAGGPLSLLPQDRRLVLVTAHRRESFGDPLNEICLALRRMAVQFEPLGVHFVYPVHLNPNVREPVYRQLADVPGISLIEPLDYLSMVQLMKRSILILTDSGGIQEEAPAFGVPVLVLRDRTERPEGIEAGVARLVGISQQAIIDAMDRLLRDEDEYAGMARGTNPYGDGRAAQRIVDSLLAG
jgi:UDP-N-acetylglucosamine 2-epimerase